ncbi:alpha/beta fold hydrolase [Nocardioides sp. ChNu-99]|nr:alpha/beta fold hydrolase [Nocardioides sp. ChNu-99]
MREEMAGGPLQRVRETAAEGPYRRFEVTYDSSGTTVSGVLLVPEGAGPFPAVVLAHGYIEPSAYVTGQGMRREQDRLARAGYVVLHTDYRGHAASSPASDLDRESRLGYTRDVVNAVRSLEREPVVDAARTAVVGRSMGGAVAYNVLVAQPGLVDAAVVFAPVSSDFVDNYERWAVPERAEVVERLTAGVGTPAENPAFYAGLSARTYADRITEPVLIHHGTADDTCPVVWSEETQAAFTAAGVDSTLLTYPGEGHAFGPQFEVSMERTIAFLGEHLTSA